mgnify:CR=1 FL=1
MRWFRRWFRRPLRTLPSQTAYALWAQSYPAQAHNRLMQIEQAAMIARLPDVRGRVVLDLACGTGRYGILARTRGAAQVIGCDNSLPMLRHADINQTALAPLTHLPLASGTIDLVLCGLAVGHIADIRPALAEIRRVLAPDGVALISDLHPFQALSGAERTFTAEDGSVYAVEHHIHLISDYITTAHAVGLTITDLAEPSHESYPVVLILRLQPA